MPASDGTIAKKPKGIPSKITLTRLIAVVAYLSNGLDQGSSARAVGVHPNTMGRWIARGRTEMVRVEDDLGVDPYEVIPTMDDRWPYVGDTRDEQNGGAIIHVDHWTVIPLQDDNGQTPSPMQPQPIFDPVEWPFVVFALAVEKALTAFESRMLQKIQDAAMGSNGAPQSWQAAAWMLERKYPNRYGRPEARLRIDAKATATGGGVQATIEVVSVDDIEAKFEEIAGQLPTGAEVDPNVIDAEIVE